LIIDTAYPPYSLSGITFNLSAPVSFFILSASFSVIPEFEKYIKQAYEAGVADGIKSLASAPTKPILRGEPKIEPLPYIGDPPGWWRDNVVWCDASAVNNDISCIYTVKGE
jgi:hypothetical protein